jgi:hypothetical protein
MHQKQKPLYTHPEIVAGKKKNIIRVFYMPCVCNNNGDAR